MKRKNKAQTKFANPVTRSIIKSQIVASLTELKTLAERQALMGDSAETLIERSGVLLYAIADAVRDAGIPETEPDVRILKGMGGSLELLARFPSTLEDHRPAIQSGLAAIERLIPRLDITAIGCGFLNCRAAVQREGFGAADIRQMLGGKAQTAPNDAKSQQ